MTESARERLDEEKLEMLRRWGEGLRQAGSDEFAAAGRAILMLIDEVEQLHVDLWHARQGVAEVASVAAPVAELARDEPRLAVTLRERLRLRRRADPDDSVHIDQQPVEGEENLGGSSQEAPFSP
jgi:hypothetical protein